LALRDSNFCVICQKLYSSCYKYKNSTIYTSIIITRNSAKLTDQRGRYACMYVVGYVGPSRLSSISHILPTSNIDILVGLYYLFSIDISEQHV